VQRGRSLSKRVDWRLGFELNKLVIAVTLSRNAEIIKQSLRIDGSLLNEQDPSTPACQPAARVGETDLEYPILQFGAEEAVLVSLAYEDWLCRCMAKELTCGTARTWYGAVSGAVSPPHQN